MNRFPGPDKRSDGVLVIRALAPEEPGGDYLFRLTWNRDSEAAASTAATVLDVHRLVDEWLEGLQGSTD